MQARPVTGPSMTRDHWRYSVDRQTGTAEFKLAERAFSPGKALRILTDPEEISRAPAKSVITASRRLKMFGNYVLTTQVQRRY